MPNQRIAFCFLLLVSTCWALERPNFVIIVPDDHRWDGTGYMQERMGASGRLARFPWIVGHTPGLDRLSTEGIVFSNAFVTYSLCSPSRATMLTGRPNHLNGIIDNRTHFPLESVTYATLLQEAGYRTGYFGKWHMGDQLERPGFSHVATFRNQGDYYGNTFHVDGRQVYEGAWVDDVSTDYLLEFIESQAGSQQPFLAFIGFKTPHDPRVPPERHSKLFADKTPVGVPNMTIDPPFRPGANAGTWLEDNQNYFECIVGIDDNVTRILDRLDHLNLSDSTVVIYISDNGYFQGEHGLGDKRAAYEESIRIPFIIRYPALQQAVGERVELALNLDIAPTILDMAGLKVPEEMQGCSLKPLLEGQEVPQWRTSFLYAYNRDPAYPDAIPSHLAVWRMDGGKLVHYPFNGAWTEMFNVVSDPYELHNLAGDPSQSSLLEQLYTEMTRLAGESGFLRMEGLQAKEETPQMVLTAGRGFNFQLESSPDLLEWNPSTRFKGTGLPVAVELLPGGSGGNEIIVGGSSADYALTKTPVTAVSGGSGTLRVGANSNSPAGGRNAVLVFPLPTLAPGAGLDSVTLQVTAWRKEAAYDGDLWAMGIKGDTVPLLDYLDSDSGDPGSVKLQEAFLDTSLGSTFQSVESSSSSGLKSYLQAFYDANPGYAGGQYLFLRINPDLDPGMEDIYYTVYSADMSTESLRPRLRLLVRENATSDGADRFYRVRFDDPGTP